jgi:hypothetical protein
MARGTCTGHLTRVYPWLQHAGGQLQPQITQTAFILDEVKAVNQEFLDMLDERTEEILLTFAQP